jgi:hypothetical protein
MTRRRAPHWLVQTTGGLVAAVLVAGLTAATSVPHDTAPPESERPRVAAEERRPVQPRPAPEPAPPLPPSEPEGIEALGPPPGPQFDPRPEHVAAPQDRYALLVGVTDYRPPTVDTIGSANDVRAIAAHLLESGWRPENIHVLVDGQVTGAALRAGMAWLAERGRPGTFSMFHWSGHVKQLGGGTEALWPVDRDWVRDRDVTAALSAVQGRLWVDIAGCEAGSFLPGLPSDRVLVSASSRGVEKSYEYPEWGMSVWTGLLLDLGIRRRGADADGDGRVTMGEALRYSTYYAQSITWLQRPYGRQTPQVEGDPVRGWTLADPPA